MSSPSDVSTQSLLEATDWAATPLGPRAQWPCSLASYVSMIMAMPWPAIIFWGDDQRQLYNDGYAVIMGPRHPRYFGAPYRDCWPDTYPTIHPWMRRVLDAGETIEVERTHIPLTRYGFDEEAHFTFIFSPLRDDEGRIAGILQPVFEVTDTVLADRRAALLRAMAEADRAADPAAALMQALASDAADVPFAAMWLRPPGAPTARRVPGVREETLDATSLAALDDAARQVLDRGEPRLVEGLRPASSPASPEVPLSRAMVLPIDSGLGEPARGVLAVGLSRRLAFDERYRAFAEMLARQVGATLQRASAVERAEQQRRFLEGLFEQAPAGIAVLRGPRRVVELVNPACLAMVGGRARTGVPLLEAMPELGGSRLEEVLRRVAATGEPYVATEVPVRWPAAQDGALQERWCTFVYQPLRQAGVDDERLLVLAFDVTGHVLERLRALTLTDELRREHARKDEFLAMLAHELRNPLAPIRSAAEVLLRAPQDESRVRWASGVIGRQVRHMVALIDDLLDVSRVTRGLARLRREPQDMKRVAAEAIEQARPVIDARGHRLHVEMDRGPAGALGDGERLVQVIVNLLDNAAKFTPQGGEIGLALRVDAAAQEVTVEVRDNGEGIEPALLPHVFDLFVQGPRGGDRAMGGLGIGLALVRHLVEQQGGRVACRSAGRQRGSVFSITLPSTALPAAPARAAATVEPPTVARRRVLVVDDNEDAALLLGLQLEQQGHEVRVEHRPEAALDVASRWAPEVCLLDIGLPGFDGHELARRIRRLEASARALLVAVTGYGQAQDRQAAQDAGFDHYLTKPIDAAELRALLAAPAPSR